jgi:hypothetical protein
MAVKAAKKWTRKELVQPIQVTLTKGLLDSDRDKKNKVTLDSAYKQQREKLDLLFAEYAIPKGAWSVLAYRLALDFVPGIAII